MVDKENWFSFNIRPCLKICCSNILASPFISSVKRKKKKRKTKHALFADIRKSDEITVEEISK